MKKVVFAVLGLLLGSIAVAGVGAAEHHSGRGGLLSEKLRQQLNLTADQEQQWQALKKEQETLHGQMRDSHKAIRALLDSELNKPAPDLQAVVDAINKAHEDHFAARKQFQQDALKFYAGLSPERQSIVIAEIKNKLAKFDSWREKRRHED